jgi:hypothetical protein
MSCIVGVLNSRAKRAAAKYKDCLSQSQPAAQPCGTGPRKIASQGASLRHSPAARGPGKLPLQEPACGTALRHRPQEDCLSRSQPAAQPCGMGLRKIASQGASLRHSLAARAPGKSFIFSPLSLERAPQRPEKHHVDQGIPYFL